MKKKSKLILAIMIVFMQLSSPITVFADTLDEINDEEINNTNEEATLNNEDDTDNIIDNTTSDSNSDIPDNKQEELNTEENNQTNNDITDNKSEDTNDNTTDTTNDSNNNAANEENKTTEVIDNSNTNQEDNFNDNNIKSDTTNEETQKEDNSPVTSFDVNATVSDNKIKININYDDEFEYIAKLTVTFNNIKDGNIKDTKEVVKTLLIDKNTIELDDIGANLNGNYNLNVEIYKIEDSISDKSEDNLNAYISSKESIYKDTKEKFYENKIETKFSLATTGSTDIVCNEKNCNMPIDATDKVINITYNITEGDKDTDGAFVEYAVNDKIALNSNTIDFNNLLQGTYQIKGILKNKNYEIIATDTLTITYGDFANNTDLEDYFLNKNIDKNSKKISMTLIEESKLNELVNSLVTKVLEDNLSCKFNVDTASETIISNDCYARISDSDYLPNVNDLIQAFSTNDMYASIVDKDNKSVSASEYIATKMQLQVNIFDVGKIYKIIVKGDLDGGYAEDSDANYILDIINGKVDNDKYLSIAADVNNDNIVNMLDVSMMAAAISESQWIFINGNYDEFKVSLERENTKILKVGDEFKIILKINGFDKDYLNGLDALLKYDKEILELINYKINDTLLDYSSDSDNRLIQVGKQTVYEDGVFITFTFKVLKAGNTNFDVSNFTAGKDGVKLNVPDTASINIEIAEEKDSTSNTNNNPVANFSNTDNSNNTKTADNKASDNLNTSTSTIDNTNYYNNYLSELKIKGYDIDFKKNILEYNITVDNDVDSLDITAIAEDTNSSVRIYGNSNFKEGENTVKIVVTASDGSDRTYIIKVNKKAKDVVKKVKNSNDKASSNNTEKTIIIILIVLVGAGLLYLVFKKDDE